MRCPLSVTTRPVAEPTRPVAEPTRPVAEPTCPITIVIIIIIPDFVSTPSVGVIPRWMKEKLHNWYKTKLYTKKSSIMPFVSL